MELDILLDSGQKSSPQQQPENLEHFRAHMSRLSPPHFQGKTQSCHFVKLFAAAGQSSFDSMQINRDLQEIKLLSKILPFTTTNQIQQRHSHSHTTSDLRLD